MSEKIKFTQDDADKVWNMQRMMGVLLRHGQIDGLIYHGMSKKLREFVKETYNIGDPA